MPDPHATQDRAAKRCPCGTPLCALIDAIKAVTGWPDDRAINAALKLRDEAEAR